MQEEHNRSLQKLSRFVVIGGANVDIMGIADDPLRPQDSNPGTIRTMLGGVAAIWRKIWRGWARVSAWSAWSATTVSAAGSSNRDRRAA